MWQGPTVAPLVSLHACLARLDSHVPLGRTKNFTLIGLKSTSPKAYVSKSLPTEYYCGIGILLIATRYGVQRRLVDYHVDDAAHELVASIFQRYQNKEHLTEANFFAAATDPQLDTRRFTPENACEIFRYHDADATEKIDLWDFKLCRRFRMGKPARCVHRRVGYSA